MTDDTLKAIRERLKRSSSALAEDAGQDGLAQAILDIAYLLSRIDELEGQIESDRQHDLEEINMQKLYES